jgi:HAD superfamily hydrolase (TIGR01484 family)
LIEEAIKEHLLPVPDFVIGDVGTTIYHVGDEHDWIPQHRWEEIIAPDWCGRSAGDLAELLADLPELRLQEADKQNRFKLSYYVELHHDQEKVSSVILKRLEQAGMNTRLIWSIDDPEGIALLDILPASASKFHAIEALMEQQCYNFQNTVFCGDSGNDLEVLVSRLQAVVVANAETEIKDMAQAMAAENGNSAQLYIARGGFMGMNGNYSAGMLEGIAHYCPSASNWM